MRSACDECAGEANSSTELKYAAAAKQMRIVESELGEKKPSRPKRTEVEKKVCEGQSMEQAGSAAEC